MRANKPRMTLLHFMVEEAERENRRVIEFVDELYPKLQKSHRYGSLRVQGVLNGMAGSGCTYIIRGNKYHINWHLCVAIKTRGAKGV